MIEIQHLTKRYGRTEVVKDFSLSISEGESVALWGPNGAGKTTVVRCILGLVRYDGTIEIDGLDAQSRGKAVRARMGYVPQELSFYDDMTADDLLDYSASLRHIGPDRIDEVAEMVDLTDHLSKKVRELSGGLKQRLGIAAALIHDPQILLLDEPTSNLDAKARYAVIELLEDMRHQGRTLLVTSHHIDEVGMLVDRVVAMENGRVNVICEPTDLAAKLGLRAWLHLILKNDTADRALKVLENQGFTAKMNSRGILVEVSAQEKGAAVAALQHAGIEIKDLEVWR